MRALITGITGFVGSHLAESLIAQEVDVFGLSRHGKWPDDFPENLRSIPVTTVDLLDGQSLRQVLARTRPDCIFHLAGQANIPESFRNPEETWRANYLGSRTLFDSVSDVLPEARILSVSSGNVYGQPLERELPITEMSICRPATPYGVSKLAVDLLARKYNDNFGLKIVIARAFNHLGPRQSSSYALASFARQIADIERNDGHGAVKVGNLDVYRDFADVRDVVRAYQAILANAPIGRIVNVARGESILLRDALGMMLNMTDCEVSVQQDAELVRRNDLSRISVDTRVLREEIGWRPEFSMEQTLRDTLDYWRQRNHES